jgi:hypothetical protein
MSLFLGIGWPGAIASARACIEPDDPSNAQALQELSANAIVNMAYRGCYKNHGIPGYTRFVQQIAIGRITAKRLIDVSGAPYSHRLERAIDSELRILALEVVGS